MGTYSLIFTDLNSGWYDENFYNARTKMIEAHGKKKIQELGAPQHILFIYSASWMNVALKECISQ